jgi:hypothetical protein
MSDAEDYYRLAAEYLALADDPNISQAARRCFIEVAVTWKQLAEDVREKAPLGSPDRAVPVPASSPRSSVNQGIEERHLGGAAEGAVLVPKARA